MVDQMKRRIWRIATPLLLVLVILCAGFGLYTADHYKAGLQAQQILQEDEAAVHEQNWLYIKGNEESAGLIFYPGAKVEYTAYLPLMTRFAQNGVNCFLTEMPFNLAFFGVNRAEKIMEAHPEIKTWYMAGHSLGGAFASSFAAKHADKISGVILLGAYLYGDFPAQRSVTIYGSEDQVLKREKITYKDHVYVIESGNHAQFGDYGKQKGDGSARITADEQLSQTVDLVMQTFPDLAA